VADVPVDGPPARPSKFYIFLPSALTQTVGCAVDQRLVAGFPLRPGFETGSSHVLSVVDRVALGQVFSVLRFLLPLIQSSKCSKIITIHHQELVQ
jgi:hypothetical protein